MKIGDCLIDTESGQCCIITNIKTTNLGLGIEILHIRKSDKGITCTQWHWVDKFFQNRFKIYKEFKGKVVDLGIDDFLFWLKNASSDAVINYVKSRKMD